MNCQRANCPRLATGAIALNVPAKGHRCDPASALRIVFSLQICDECFEGEKPKAQEYLNPQLRQIFEIQHRATRSPIPPDFDRAFLSKVAYNSKEWEMLNSKDKFKPL